MKLSNLISRQPFISLLMMFMATFLFLSVVSAENNKFEGKGSAPFKGYDIKTAEKLAIKRATKSALEEAVGSLLNPKVFNEKYDSLDAGIFTKYKTFVTDVMPISRMRKGKSYEVVVWAVVDMGALKSKLVTMGLLLPPEKMPRWLIVIPEMVNDASPRSAWIVGQSNPSASEFEIGGIISQYGYRVVKPGGKNNLPLELVENPMKNVAGIIKAAQGMGATHVLLGKAAIYTARGITNENYHLGTALLTVSAYEVASSKIVGNSDSQITLELPEEDGLDKRVMRAACGDFRNEIKAWLHAVNPSGAAGFVEVTLSLNGFTNYSEYNALMALLEQEIPGVRKISLVSLARGFAEIEVRYAGESEHLIRQLTKRQFKGFSLELEGEKEGKYIIKVIPLPD